MKIQNTSAERIEEIYTAQHTFFATGDTLPYDFRRKQLKNFLHMLDLWQQRLCDALWTDLHKSEEEAILTEISIVRGEVKNHLAHLKSWMRRTSKRTPLKMFPSRSYIVNEPLGNTLIVSPWNYPVQLLLNPLVGAISAGCTAILKPSPYVPNVSHVIEEMIQSTFNEKYIAVVQGNRDVNTALLAHRFDLIFFTGSPELGKKVMTAAARYLTPVVLELGGKSPCIVDEGADVALSAQRIAWGKTLNAGQTCIAPDYLLIHTSKKTDFIKAFQQAITNMHGKDVRTSKHYVRLVSEKAFDRVSSYINDGKVVCGGGFNAGERYIEPTLLDGVSAQSSVMKDEIFGPILPMLTFDKIEEVINFVNSREKPLALYYFGKIAQGREVIRCTSSGGACINDTIMHIANENLPFGGVGNSGMGHYHGYDSFSVFSHRRSVVETPTYIDLPFRYMPYKLFNLVKRIL